MNPFHVESGFVQSLGTFKRFLKNSQKMVKLQSTKHLTFKGTHESLYCRKTQRC